MQTITIDFIQSLKPCEDGLQNLIKFHPNFNGDISDFILLDNIPSADKIWLASKVMNKNQLVRFSILCVESVLHHFESKYPNDKRPRLLLDFMNNIKDFDEMTKLEIDELEVLRTGVAVAYYHTANAAYDAATAATATTAAAYDAATAATATYYAAAVYGAYDDATAAAAGAGAAKLEQQDLNLLFLQTVLME